MAKQSEKSKIIKEIYRSGQERVQFLLNLIGTVNSDTLHCALTEDDWNRFRLVMGSIKDSMQFDRSEDYRAAVQHVTQWCHRAGESNYLKSCIEQNKSLPYSIKKGIEFLQVVMYRDLRRINLESEESRRYFVFCSLIQTMPTFANSVTLSPTSGHQ
jgi:hypothetical protein